MKRSERGFAIKCFKVFINLLLVLKTPGALPNFNLSIILITSSSLILTKFLILNFALLYHISVNSSNITLLDLFGMKISFCLDLNAFAISFFVLYILPLSSTILFGNLVFFS